MYKEIKLSATRTLLPYKAPKTPNFKTTRTTSHLRGHGSQSPPYIRGRYEILDCILTTDKWKNICIDAETEITHDIDTRHMPLIAITKLAFKIPTYTPSTRKNTRYRQGPNAENRVYNNELANAMPTTTTRESKINTIIEIAQTWIPEKPNNPSQD